MTDDDPFAGKGDQLAGTGKEAVGKVTDDPELEGEGKGQRMGGKLEEAAHSLKEKASGVVDKLHHHDK